MVTSGVLAASEISSSLSDLLSLTENASSTELRSALSSLKQDILKWPRDLTSKTPVVVRANCVVIDKNEVLNSYGHDLYIIAGKIILNGEIRTTVAEGPLMPLPQVATGSRVLGGDLKIIAVKVETNRLGKVVTGSVDEKHLLKQIQEQAIVGKTEPLTVPANFGQPHELSIVEKYKVRRAAGVPSPFDTDGSTFLNLRESGDAKKIFETYFTAKAKFDPDSRSGLLAWSAGRGAFNQAVAEGKFWEFINMASNQSDWISEFQFLERRVQKKFQGFESAAQQNETSEITGADILEWAAEDRVKKDLDLTLQMGGSVEIFYIVGEKLEDLNSRLTRENEATLSLNKMQLHSILGDVISVNRIRTIESEVTLRTSSSPSLSQKFTDQIVIPTPVKIQNIHMRGPIVRQSPEDYEYAFRSLGLREGVRLDVETRSSLNHLISIGK
jgi:hypothetical protein